MTATTTIRVRKVGEDRGNCREYFRASDTGWIYAKQLDKPGVYVWHTTTAAGEPDIPLHDINFIEVQIGNATCKVLRNAFFGEDLEAVIAAIPELRTGASGWYGLEKLLPIGEQLGLVPFGDLTAPAGTMLVRFGIGHGDHPWEGRWMEHTVPLAYFAGYKSLKEAILAECLVLGNRYGCCWFRGFA